MKSIHGKIVYTGEDRLQDAYIVCNGRQIADVADRPRGEMLGSYAVITPAFIDPHSHIGLHRAGEPGDEAESNDRMDSMQALPDALDSVQMDDAAFRDAIEAGVLYSCVMPGSGNIVGGQAAVIRHYGADTTEALVARAGIKAAFGYNPRSTVEWKGTRPTTRMGAAALLRSKLDEVQRKMHFYRNASEEKRREMTFSYEEDIYRRLLERRLRLRAHVHKIDDIAALLRLTDEFRLDVSVEHAGDVHRPEIFRALARRNIPVVYGPVDSFAYKVELRNENWRNIRLLVESGVEFGLMTDHPVVLCRQLFLQTRWFLRCGLSRRQAIALVSRNNARILGIDRILGSLRAERWASFVCWNGDPFDLGSYPVAVFGEGKRIFSE